MYRMAIYRSAMHEDGTTYSGANELDGSDQSRIAARQPGADGLVDPFWRQEIRLSDSVDVVGVEQGSHRDQGGDEAQRPARLADGRGGRASAVPAALTLS